MPHPTSFPTLGRLLLLSLLSTTPACHGLFSTAVPSRILDTTTGDAVSMDVLVEALADQDVVFVGEHHDTAAGHELQNELTRLLIERRASHVALSMEMFERDTQEVLDRYLRGEIDEAAFRESSRPWPGYDEFYRPAVEAARAAGAPVIAANIPRPLAARVNKEGLEAVAGEAHVPREVHVEPGDYRDRVLGALGGHGESMADMDKDRFFAAQCIKDDAMAEAIADHLAAKPGTSVIHWNGAFHSDHGLGTVERLKRRRPDVRVAILTTVRSDDPRYRLTDEERAAADFAIVVGVDG